VEFFRIGLREVLVELGNVETGGLSTIDEFREFLALVSNFLVTYFTGLLMLLLLLCLLLLG